MEPSATGALTLLMRQRISWAQGYPFGPGTSVTGGSSTSAAAITGTGFGTLHFSVTSSNPALIPASLVAAGKAGGHPTTPAATCGNGTSACMVSATPAIGQIEMATVTLIATDGGNPVGHVILNYYCNKAIYAYHSNNVRGNAEYQTLNTAIAPVKFDSDGPDCTHREHPAK